MKILAIDHGTKNIGLAISDELEITAKPLPQIRTKKDSSELQTIAEICAKESVDKIVIGIPTGTHKNNSKQSQIVKSFAKDLFELTMLPIILWDETYSSQKAMEKTKKNIDSQAAKLILQEYLSSPDKNLDL